MAGHIPAIGMGHEMDTRLEFLRLMNWLSPSFPVGSFSYSHGLEWAITEGLVSDRSSLAGWISDLAEHGSAWNDMILLAAAWRGEDVAALAEALSPSAERYFETLQLGAAFAAAAAPWVPGLPRTAYPVTFGIGCRRMHIELEMALVAWLNSFVGNLVSVAVRLIPLGQVAGVATLRELEPVVLAAARRAAGSTVEGLGSATLLADIASMKHEAQQTRVYRT